MGKLVVLLSFCGIFASLFLINKYSSHPIDSTRFDYDKAKLAHEEKMAKLHPVVEHKEEEKAAPEKKKEVVEIALDTPELANGHKVYFKKGKCITCHGKRGEGKKSQKAPAVAGQHQWYLEKQLLDMKEGRRINEKMNVYLKSLNQQDLKDAALYLSKLPWPR